MPLAARDRLGPYEILAPIGKGGMGEVYRARDTKLDRDVAIKVLPAALAQHPDRLARFEREAKVLAALNHSNIAVIYGLEDHAIVMELVEGPTLADRLLHVALPLEESLKIAAQIADALEAAHEKGVVHRDLKPANVKVREDGAVKVLDFGLATVASASTDESQADVGATDSPTLTMGATESGVILGTASYMSPEQASGKRVDRRADIWSFGVVLWEMLTGKHLFHGETVSHTLADVLREEIDFSKLPASTPGPIRELLKRCLDRDLKTRLRDIGEARIAIQKYLAEAPLLPSAAAPRRLAAAGWLAAGVLAAGVFAAALWIILWRQPSPEERAMQFQINPPSGAEFVLGAGGGAAISPDGRAIAFVAVSGGIPKLWVRPLDSIAARELPGTDAAEQPFWSPDSRSLGFFSGGKLKWVDVTGGPPVLVADASAARGATWLPEGTIVFTPLVTGGLQRVAASGGAAAVSLTNLDSARGESSHRWPQFLPGGRRFIYYVQSPSPRVGGTYLGSLDRPLEKIQLTTNSFNALYAPPRGPYPGYLLFLRENTLVAQPFDPERGQLSGEAAPVPGAEAVSFAGGTNSAYFSVSNQGALVFGHGNDRYQLTWFNREGKVLSRLGQPDRYLSIRISPDGKGVAATRTDAAGRGGDVWRIEFTGAAPNRLTFDGNGYRTAWSPDGGRIFYSSNGGMFETEASGVGQGKPVIQTQHPAYTSDWSPDGRYLMYAEASPETQGDLWIVPTAGDRKPVPYLKTPFNELDGQFSPDGKWVAYTSDESGGRNEVYVRAFPAGAAKFPVSNSGGGLPRWRQDGRELFYRALDGRLMAASVRPVAQGLEFGTPAALFATVPPAGLFAYPYDVSPDGQRILALAPAAGEAGSSLLTVLINWQAGLKK
jgi:Tol biopolymer transport system component/tRNA A-37 threonylcarbamoyl transferase component Bud32